MVILWYANMWWLCSCCLSFSCPYMLLHIWQILLQNWLIKLIICLNMRISYTTSDTTCIASFLDIPRLSIYLVTIKSSTKFIFIYDSNVRFIIGKAILYLIGFITILLKPFTTVIIGTVSSPKYKSHSLHTMSIFEFLCLPSDFSSLGQLYSVQHEILFRFSSGSSLSWC